MKNYSKKGKKSISKKIILIMVLLFVFNFFVWSKNLENDQSYLRMKAEGELYKVGWYDFYLVDYIDICDDCFAVTRGNGAIFMLKNSDCDTIYIACNHEVCHNLVREKLSGLLYGEEELCTSIANLERGTILNHPVCDELLNRLNCAQKLYSVDDYEYGD